MAELDTVAVIIFLHLILCIFISKLHSSTLVNKDYRRGLSLPSDDEKKIQQHYKA
jgi:hypothetical protein